MEKLVRLEKGVSCDQEKFLTLLPQILDYVKEDGTQFDSYDYKWQYNEKGLLEFEVRFYAKH